MVRSLGGEVVSEAPDGYAAIVAAVVLEPDVGDHGLAYA
jgi:hypothetical protein